MNKQPVIILSAPSGAGKSTLVHYVLERFPQLAFSISATSRAPRGGEQHGTEYYFLSTEAFEEGIAREDFLEWEEVYKGFYYGTPKSELKRIQDEGKVVLFEIDVKGGLRLKQFFGDEALSIFIMPPSLEALRARLEARGTDSPESIQKRVDKAEEEMRYAADFDKIVVNDNLDEAKQAMEALLLAFLNN
jgi:guanylate kinase